MTLWKKFVLAGCCAAVALGCARACAGEESQWEKFKEGARLAGEAVVQGTRNTAEKVADGAERAGTAVVDGSHKAGRAIAETYEDAKEYVEKKME